VGVAPLLATSPYDNKRGDLMFYFSTDGLRVIDGGTVDIVLLI